MLREILLIALVLPSLGWAEDARARFDAADRLLNQTYLRVIKSLPPATNTALRESQRAWIAFRDANGALIGSARSADSQAALTQKAADTLRRVDFLSGSFTKLTPVEGDRDMTALTALDRQLNEQYKLAIASLPGAVGEELRAAQRAWLAVRDADIAALTAMGAIRSDNAAWAVRRVRAAGRIAFLCSLSSDTSGTETGGVSQTPPSAVTTHPSPPAMVTGNQKTESTNAANSPAGLEADVRVEFSDDSRGHATISRKAGLIATALGNRITLWDPKSGYLLLKKTFDFEICGIQFDASGNVLWVFWYDNPRYGSLNLSAFKATGLEPMRNDLSLQYFRPRAAECIFSPENGYIVTAKVFTFSKGNAEKLEDLTTFSLHSAHVEKGKETLPKIAEVNIKGIWSLGSFITPVAFTFESSDHKRRILSIEDITSNNRTENPLQSPKAQLIKYIETRRSPQLVASMEETSRLLEAKVKRMSIASDETAGFRCADGPLSLWFLQSERTNGNLVFNESTTESIALKDKNPADEYLSEKGKEPNGVVWSDARLSWRKDILSLTTETRFLRPDQRLADVAPKREFRTIDFASMRVSSDPAKTTSPEPETGLAVDEDGVVKNANGERLLRIKKKGEGSGVQIWKLPGTDYYIVLRGAEIEVVDKQGKSICSAERGDSRDIDFAPDKSAFALVGVGPKNHVASPEFFELKLHGPERPSIQHVFSGPAISNVVDLSFFPFVLHIKPEKVTVTRFKSDQVISEWGFDPAPVYAGEPVFAINAESGRLALCAPGRDRFQLLGISDSGLLENIGLLKVQNDALVLVEPDNYYLQRGATVKDIHFVQGAQAFPFEQFDLRLNRPDIVLKRLGAPSEAIAIAQEIRAKQLKRMGITEAMLKPDFHLPKIALTREVPASTDAREIKLHINASDSKYPLDRLRVYVNNVPLNGKDGESLRSFNTRVLERTIPIKLASGLNKIQVSVLNTAGAESLYATTEVTMAATRLKPTLYVVAMGVSQYSRPEINLNYAAKDAEDVAARIKAKSGKFYGEVQSLVLKDQAVTREGLVKAREFLSVATIDDAAIIFISGHGVLDEKYDYYFGTSDIDPAEPGKRGIAFEEVDDILAGLACLKKAMLVDTCHAGELDEDEKKQLAMADSASARLRSIPLGQRGVAMRAVGIRGAPGPVAEVYRGRIDWYGRLQDMFVDLRRGSGATIVSSSAGAEFSFESTEQQNGLFTYALLEGLDGRGHSGKAKDRTIRISELGEYIRKRVAELTDGKQTPNVRRVNLEEDFALGEVSPANR